jgi:hypothetical protein
MSASLSQPLCIALLGALLGPTNIPLIGEGNQSSSYDENPGRGHSVVLQSRGKS